MDLQLRDKVAIVNGASQGIGYAIARMLAGEGAKVVWGQFRGNHGPLGHAQLLRLQRMRREHR